LKGERVSIVIAWVRILAVLLIIVCTLALASSLWIVLIAWVFSSFQRNIVETVAGVTAMMTIPVILTIGIVSARRALRAGERAGLFRAAKCALFGIAGHVAVVFWVDSLPLGPGGFRP
jgi:hypothetical protein